MRPGPLNLITDVPGLLVGNAQDATLRSGVTVLTADRPFTAAVHVMGGAPGTRETDLLAPDKLVQEVDALFLSGGSAFGLDAGTGVMAGLRAMGRGFPVGPVNVPIVPGAILFDLLNGGDKDWGDSPYPALGRAVSDHARKLVAKIGVVDTLPVFGAEVGNLVTRFDQPFAQFRLQGERGVIGGYGNTHGWRHNAVRAESPPACAEISIDGRPPIRPWPTPRRRSRGWESTVSCSPSA